MKKPIISVDIDDVIADSTENLRLTVNQRYKLNLTVEQYKIQGKYWGYYESVWKKAGVGHLVNFSALNEEMVEDQSHVSDMDYAHQVLKGLKDRFKFILVTSRDRSWEKATLAWVEERFTGIFDGLYFTEHHHSEAHKTKGILCKELGVSLHIDDNVEHCRTVTEQGIRTVLYGDYGWQLDIAEGQVRCRTWQEVGEYLDGVEL